MMPYPSQLSQKIVTAPGELGQGKKLPFTDKEKEPIQTPSLPEEEKKVTAERRFYRQIHVTDKLPPQVAILHIYQSSANEYNLMLMGSLIPKKELKEPKQRPQLSLGELVQQKKPPEEIRDALYVFSLSNPELCNWVKALRQTFQRTLEETSAPNAQQLCLVIVDYTDFEIPWEMLELSSEDSPNQYLGAIITTVRWQPVRIEDTYLNLQPKAEKCCGQAIAYVLNNDELQGVGPELQILEQLQAVVYRNITTFEDHLQRPESNCGFIYISCHGGFSTNPSEIWIGSERHLEQRLRLLNLRRRQLTLVKKSPSIVFINACHSGRHQAHPSIPKSYRVGFAELFLAKGARGVIGTLGAVGDRHAAQFARDLIQESLNSPDLPVAALLRQLRWKVVQNLPENPTTEDLLPFIYTFMYVYYGNPLTVLRLTPDGGKSNA
jgi:hypothetical protein